MHDFTTKIQHKVGFVNAQKKAVGFESVSIEVYFWRENLDEISSYQVRLATMRSAALVATGTGTATATGQQACSRSDEDLQF